MTWKELRTSGDYTLHHVAMARGYVSRKKAQEGEVIPYSGKFGKGYKVLTPRWDTTQYVDVWYYIDNRGVIS